jgi:glycine/D-amino acid oxidase-like deaminating enzyme
VNASERPIYVASWYTDTMVATPDRRVLQSDLDVDVCVVGAGLAGLTTARELARRGWSVAVLEARRIAWNASGRNTGFVLPGFAESMDVVVRRVGLEHAKQLWALSEAGLDYVRTTISETGMPGVDPTPGWLKVSKTDQAEHDLALVKLIGQELGGQIEGWPTDRVREVLKSRAYFHAIHYPTAFHIHPLNYALGLAAAAKAAGARIYEETPVVSIDTAGVRKRIDTPAARIRADHIVLAGNVHLGAVVPRIAGTLLPIWTYVVTTAPLGRRLHEAIPYQGAVSDTDLADNHYRIVGGDRLMWSGGMNTWERNPQRLVQRLKRDIRRVYPQLGDVAITHAWNGVLGNALHRMPQIGELSPRVWLASGFGGHGLNTTAMAGNIVARAIAEGDDTWRLFLPYELVWAGGRIGRAVAQTHYWWFHAREVANAREAQKREAEFRRNEELSEPPVEQQVTQDTPPVAAEPVATPPIEQPVAPIPAAEIPDAEPVTETAIEAPLPVQDAPSPAVEFPQVTTAEQVAASSVVDEPHDVVAENVRKKGRERKARDATHVVAASEARTSEPALLRKKKSGRNARRRRPVRTGKV